MHIPPPAAEGSILEGKPTDLVHRLLKELAPEHWPVPMEALPPGSALVGGAVRDGLLQRLGPTPDLDLVVPADALLHTRQLAKTYGGACVVLDEERDMARLVVKGWTIDLARREGTSLNADLQRRDYRLNAIALELGPLPRLVDPTDGLNDLKTAVVTAVSEQNLIDDPLRLLRGIRIAAELNFAIAEDTWLLLERHHQRLGQAAPERIQAELMKLVQASGADQGIQQLKACQLLKPWATDRDDEGKATVPLALSNQAAQLSSDERAEALPLHRLTGLISDQGLKDLRFSKRQIQRCSRLRHWQQQDDGQGFTDLEPQQRLRLHAELGNDLPALSLQLPEPVQKQWLRRWRDPSDPLFHPEPPIDGSTLQTELEIPPGPQLGQLLKHLTLERAFGRLKDRQTTLQVAQEWWMVHGPTQDPPAGKDPLAPPRCD